MTARADGTHTPVARGSIRGAGLLNRRSATVRVTDELPVAQASTVALFS